MGNDNFIGADILIYRSMIACRAIVVGSQNFVIIPFNGNFFISFGYCTGVVGIYCKISLLLSSNITHNYNSSRVTVIVNKSCCLSALKSVKASPPKLTIFSILELDPCTSLK